MGLDQPLPVRYIQWLSGMFTGELAIISAGSFPDQAINKKLRMLTPTSTMRKLMILFYLCANFLAGIPSSTVLCDSSEMVQCLTKSRLEGLFTSFICPGGSQFVFTHPNYAFLSSGWIIFWLCSVCKKTLNHFRWIAKNSRRRNPSQKVGTQIPQIVMPLVTWSNGLSCSPFRLVCSVPESGTAFSIRLPEALLSAVFVCQLSG